MKSNEINLMKPNQIATYIPIMMELSYFSLGL